MVNDPWRATVTVYICSEFQTAMIWIHCLTNFAENYSNTYSKFLLLYNRKIRCILGNGTETCSTEVEYESNSNKMMATHVYLSFQHVSEYLGYVLHLLIKQTLCYQLV